MLRRVQILTTHEIINSNSNLTVNFDICYTSNQIVTNHWHSHLEILFILNGTMSAICNEKSYTLRKHDLFIVNSGDIHYTRSMKDTKIILLQIPYDFLNKIIPQYDTLSFEHYFESARIDGEKDLIDIKKHLLDMSELYKQNEDGYQFLFNSHLNLMLYTLYNKFSFHKKSEDSGSIHSNTVNTDRLKEIITYIEMNYKEPLSLTDTAKLFGLNPEYFCRYFKKNIGFTFLEYVNMVRLPHIYSEILSTNNSITDIQERHGFINYKVFNRMFKELYGCTPSKVRRTSRS